MWAQNTAVPEDSHRIVVVSACVVRYRVGWRPPLPFPSFLEWNFAYCVFAVWKIGRCPDLPQEPKIVTVRYSVTLANPLQGAVLGARLLHHAQPLFPCRPICMLPPC